MKNIVCLLTIILLFFQGSFCWFVRPIIIFHPTTASTTTTTTSTTTPTTTTPRPIQVSAGFIHGRFNQSGSIVFPGLLGPGFGLKPGLPAGLGLGGGFAGAGLPVSAAGYPGQIIGGLAKPPGAVALGALPLGAPPNGFAGLPAIGGIASPSGRK